MTGSLFLVPVDLDDRVADIEEQVTVARVGHEQRTFFGQVAKEPGRDRVELADMTERERPQYRPQR